MASKIAHYIRTSDFGKQENVIKIYFIDLGQCCGCSKNISCVEFHF